MSYEMKEGQGSAFANERKEKDEHADFTGKILIDGKERWLNIWKRKTRDGDTWLSVSTRPKQPKNETAVFDKTKSGNQGARGGLDDDVPFAPEFR